MPLRTIEHAIDARQDGACRQPRDVFRIRRRERIRVEHHGAATRRDYRLHDAAGVCTRVQIVVGRSPRLDHAAPAGAEPLDDSVIVSARSGRSG